MRTAYVSICEHSGNSLEYVKRKCVCLRIRLCVCGNRVFCDDDGYSNDSYTDETDDNV